MFDAISDDSATSLLTALMTVLARGGPALWAIAAVGIWVYGLLLLGALDARRHPESVFERLPLARAGIAAAPLLGLLGTVGGLVQSFQATMGDPSSLAAGIGRAMLTTEYGLLVAAPGLLLAGWVERRAERAQAALR